MYRFVRSILRVADNMECAANLDYVRLEDHGRLWDTSCDELPAGYRSGVGATRFTGRCRSHRIGSSPLGGRNGDSLQILQSPLSRASRGRQSMDFSSRSFVIHRSPRRRCFRHIIFVPSRCCHQLSTSFQCFRQGLTMRWSERRTAVRSTLEMTSTLPLRATRALVRRRSSCSR